MDTRYIAFMNDVLTANYWGEVLTVEILSKLLGKRISYPHREMYARQLLDETRHANITRSLLLSRGHDPIRAGTRRDFAFSELFDAFSQRDPVEIRAFLGENEALSSRNFSQLIRIATRQGDTETAGLYGEILNDEVSHSHSLLQTVPSSPEIEALRVDARAQMKKKVSLGYFRLFMAYEWRRS